MGEGVGEEAFARGSDEEGQAELVEALQVGEDGVVFVEALAEAEAGVEGDFFLKDAGGGDGCKAFVEFLDDEG